MARPTKFNRDTALLSAIQVFWNRGYSSSSMTDLVTAMDMRPGSIYATFGSKRELLLESIDRYASIRQEKVERIFQESRSTREGFTTVLSLMINEMACSKVVRGCLLVNLLLELGSIDQVAAKKVQEHLNIMQGIFATNLKKAQQTREISEEKDATKLSIFLMGGVYSLRVMGRAGASTEQLKVILDEILSHAFGDVESSA